MNRDKMKVSVLIPLYNAESYISDTIESCINQTYENVEIIIVDDGSTDNSYKIVEQYALKYSNVFLHKQANAGAPKARNLAFKKSSGEYIIFLDSDDILQKNKISLQINDAISHGKDNLYCGRFMRFKDSINSAVNTHTNIYKNYEVARDWLISSWRTGEMGQTSIWMVHYELIVKAGPWNEELTKNQDGEFFCRVVLNSKSIVYNDNAVVYYRVRHDSLSRNITEKSAESTLYSYLLYEHSIKQYLNKDTKYALAHCYYDFINHYYPNYPKLITQAENKIKYFGFSYHELCRKQHMSILSKYFGMKSVLILKYYLKKLKSNNYQTQRGAKSLSIGGQLD
ncbi:MAG: glycosyltransferase family 2 protein [Candidatus Thiodiazotropha sp.]